MQKIALVYAEWEFWGHVGSLVWPQLSKPVKQVSKETNLSHHSAAPSWKLVKRFSKVVRRKKKWLRRTQVLGENLLVGAYPASEK